MASPALKRFNKEYLSQADAISRMDVPQAEREKIAADIAASLVGKRDFREDLFLRLAKDPLVMCAGYEDTPCPHGREIRIHRESFTGDTAGKVRCVSCGAMQFIPQYRANVESR